MHVSTLNKAKSVFVGLIFLLKKICFGAYPKLEGIDSSCVDDKCGRDLVE